MLYKLLFAFNDDIDFISGPWSFFVIDRGQETFSIYGLTVNILGFVGHVM